MVIQVHDNKIYKEKIEQISQNAKFILVSGMCYSYMLRVYEFVFRSNPLLFASLCMRLTQA